MSPGFGGAIAGHLSADQDQLLKRFNYGGGSDSVARVGNCDKMKSEIFNGNAGFPSALICWSRVARVS